MELASETLENYLKVPYGDRLFVYTNVVTLEDLKSGSFHRFLSHERASDKHSVAMTIHEAIEKDFGASLEDRNVLDVGSSIGHFSFLMAEEGAHVIGVECDITKHKVAQAINSLHSGQYSAQFIEGRIEEVVKLYLENAVRFDLILMHNVFEYIPDEEKAALLNALSRISRRLYTTVLMDPHFIMDNSFYNHCRRLLTRIYGPRDLWVFWRGGV